MRGKSRDGLKVRKRRYTDYDRWVGIPHFLIKCQAWKTMTPNAKALLIEVWARYNGINNGEIVYGVREAEAIGMSKSVTARAFSELKARGFLVVGRDSAFSMKASEAREWFVTALPSLNGAQPVQATREFLKWVPEQSILKIKTRSRTRETQSRTGEQPGVRQAKRNIESLHSPAQGTESDVSSPAEGPLLDTIAREGYRPAPEGSAGPEPDGELTPLGRIVDRILPAALNSKLGCPATSQEGP